MGLWRETRRVRPRAAGVLRVLAVGLGAVQIAAWALLLSAVLGNWPPALPGEPGPYARAARRLVRATQPPEPPAPARPTGEQGIVERLAERLARFQRQMAEAGSRAALAAVEVAVELSLRLSAFSTGLVLILTCGWVRRKAVAWLLHIDLRGLDRRVRILERDANIRRS